MRSTFKRNIWIGFGLSLLILILSSAASYLSINILLNSSELVTHTNKVIQKLDEVLAVIKDAEAAQRGYLITGEEHFLERYNGISGKVSTALSEVRSLTSDN